MEDGGWGVLHPPVGVWAAGDPVVLSWCEVAGAEMGSGCGQDGLGASLFPEEHQFLAAFHISSPSQHLLEVSKESRVLQIHGNDQEWL